MCGPGNAEEESLARRHPTWELGLTVGTQQALKLGEQPDGVELPQEAIVMQAVPQLDDEATDERSQLRGTDTCS